MATLRIAVGKLRDWYAAQDVRVGTEPIGFRQGGGSFGGGGAGGSWEWWPEPPKFDNGRYEALVVVGDLECPVSGTKKFWAYREHSGYTFGPHPAGIDRHFVGFIQKALWVSDGWGLSLYNQRANWELADNLPLVTGYAGFENAGAVHPALPNNGTTVLPDPYAATPTRGYIEWVCDLGSPSPNPPVDGNTVNYPAEIRAVWGVRQQSCTPPFVVPVPFDDAGHRWRRRSYPYDPRDVGDPKKDPRDRDESDGVLLVPWVFVTPLGPAPFGLGGLPPVVGSPLPPVPRTPPKRGTKERKKRGTLRQILRVLDIVSESAEVVDCFFKALPKSTQRRWKKGRPNRGLVDQAGQFGIAGADWKGQAIYQNWHDVDIDKAMECVAYNQIVEDQLVGAINRKLPKGAGTAVGRAASRQKYLEERERQAQKWAAIRAQNAARVRSTRRQ